MKYRDIAKISEPEFGVALMGFFESWRGSRISTMQDKSVDT